MTKTALIAGVNDLTWLTSANYYLGKAMSFMASTRTYPRKLLNTSCLALLGWMQAIELYERLLTSIVTILKAADEAIS